jgi:uncharacterized protein involved in exopolysaccharide biosynthesis
MKVPTASRIKRYASVLFRWLVIGVGVFGLTLVAGLYVTDDVLPKVYTASATLHLPTADLMTPSASPVVEPVAFRPEFENTMLSPELLLAVIKDLGLEKEWARRLNLDQDQLPDVDALTRLEKLVKIQVQHGTNDVQITAASDVAQEAADIANAIATHYLALRQPIGLDGGPSPVRLIERAATPTEPTRPNRGLAFLVTLACAGILSLTAACFVEMILLFVRAGERAEG